MTVDKTSKDGAPGADDRAFNETLKRMLKTPPKPHEKPRRADEESKSAVKTPKK